jgi:hypothetical protein
MSAPLIVPRADAKGPSGPTSRYQLVSIGTLGGPTSSAYGINDNGDVVELSDLPDAEFHAQKGIS